MEKHSLPRLEQRALKRSHRRGGEALEKRSSSIWRAIDGVQKCCNARLANAKNLHRTEMTWEKVPLYRVGRGLKRENRQFSGKKVHRPPVVWDPKKRGVCGSTRVEIGARRGIREGKGNVETVRQQEVWEQMGHLGWLIWFS